MSPLPAEIDKAARRLRCNRWIRGYISAQKVDPNYQKMNKIYVSCEANAVIGGARLEQTAEMLKACNEQLEEAKHLLGETVNQIVKMADVVSASLQSELNKLRTARMSIANESALSLTALRDVRKFFIESDYQEQMQRLERFLNLCERMKELKRDGTLDAISDVVIRLATQEVSK